MRTRQGAKRASILVQFLVEKSRITCEIGTRPCPNLSSLCKKNFQNSHEVRKNFALRKELQRDGHGQNESNNEIFSLISLNALK